nr:GNAT family N-acetyltransferase [Nocardioides thalensis]
MGGQVRVHNPHLLTRGAVVVRPTDPYGDAAALHAWTTAERARFWGMRGLTVEEVAGIYSWIDAQPHLTANALEVDGEAVGILQTYDPFVDEIGRFYDRRPGDVGIHLLLDDGPARRGRTTEVVAAGLAFAAGIPGMRRLVFEPDARNQASVALLDRLGAERGPLVELKTSVSEKPAQFFFLGIEAVRRLVEREAASVPQ